MNAPIQDLPSGDWTFLNKHERESGFDLVYYTSQEMLIREYDVNGCFVAERRKLRVLTAQNNYQYQTKSLFNKSSGERYV